MKLHPTFTANAVSVFLFLFVAAAEVSASVSDAAQREERDLQLLGWDLPPYPTSRFTEWSSLGGTTQNEVASNLDCKTYKRKK